MLKGKDGINQRLKEIASMNGRKEKISKCRSLSDFEQSKFERTIAQRGEVQLSTLGSL
jgi:hypothetical protein